MPIGRVGVKNCSNSKRSPVIVWDLSTTAHLTPTWESDCCICVNLTNESLAILWCCCFVFHNVSWKEAQFQESVFRFPMISEAKLRAPTLYFLIHINTSLVNLMMHLATRVLANLM